MNEISELHDPEVIGETKITATAQNRLYNSISKYTKTKETLNGSIVGTLALKSFDISSGTFQVLATSPLSTKQTMSTPGVMNIINLEEYTLKIQTSANGAFNQPCEFNHYNLAEKQNQCEKITLYQYDTELYISRLNNYEAE